MTIRLDETDSSNISQKTVKAALDSLLYCSQPRASIPLEQSLPVDQFMADKRIPLSDDHRTYALNSLLVLLITDELLRYRRALEIPSREDERTLSEVKEAISLDAKMESPQLMWWSWLYYHFVRVEFNISLAEFIRIACIEERTVRRYQERGIRRLTQLLIDKEQAIRQSQSETIYQALFNQEYHR